MNYNVHLEMPNFEQAVLYAKKLEEDGLATMTSGWMRPRFWFSGEQALS